MPTCHIDDFFYTQFTSNNDEKKKDYSSLNSIDMLLASAVINGSIYTGEK